MRPTKLVHKQQGDVMDFTFRQVKDQDLVTLFGFRKLSLVDLGIQHLTKQVAHEVLIGRTDGIGEP